MAVEGSEEAALGPPTSDAPRVGPASLHSIDQVSPSGHQPMSSAEEEPAKKDALIWNDMEGLAHLPDSDLKFKINELGVLELVEVKENGEKEFMELKDLSVKLNQKEGAALSDRPSSPSLLNGSPAKIKIIFAPDQALTQRLDMDLNCCEGNVSIVEMVPVPLSPDITGPLHIFENGASSENENNSTSGIKVEIDQIESTSTSPGPSETQMVDFKMEDLISDGRTDTNGKQFIKLEFQVDQNETPPGAIIIPHNKNITADLKDPRIKLERDSNNDLSDDCTKAVGTKTRATNKRRTSTPKTRKRAAKNVKVKVEPVQKAIKETLQKKAKKSPPKKQKQEPASKPAEAEGKVENKDSLDEVLEEEVIAFCRNCGYFGLESEFYKIYYCTHSCFYSYNLSKRPKEEQAPKLRLLADLKPKTNKKSKYGSRVDEPPMIPLPTTNGTPASTSRGKKKDGGKKSDLAKKAHLSRSNGPVKISDSDRKKELRKRAEMLRSPVKKLEFGRRSEPIARKSVPIRKIDIPSTSKGNSPALSPKEIKKERRMPSLRHALNETPRRSIEETHATPIPIPIKPIERKLPVFDTFDWMKYLMETKAKSAPLKLFRQPAMPPPNPFKVGMMLEAIDPQHQSLFCAVVVVEVMGGRLRLRFIGYNENYDFWVNSDSMDIFPCGWCEEHGYGVEPPPDARTPFSWHQYMVEKEAAAAERSFFAITADEPLPDCGVRVGMKLEAVDVKNANLVCVATATKVLGDRFLVHFDSWDSNYDYWTDCSSPFIHPVGWCEKNNIKITPPNKLKDDFSWDSYLVNSKAIAMPSRLFQPLPPVGFKKGFKLEAIDKRNPFILRVATVADIDGHKIILHFDGWDSLYDYKVDELSEDLHPIGWAAHTGHTLQPPPQAKETSIQYCSVSCPIAGCYGVGHVKGPKFLTHNTEKNCPYAPHNVLKFWEPADRIIVIETIPGSVRPLPETKVEEPLPVLKKEPAQVLNRKRASNGKKGIVVKKRLLAPKPTIKIEKVEEEEKRPDESLALVPVQPLAPSQSEVIVPARESLQFQAPPQDELPPYFNTNAGDIKSLVGNLNAETVVKWSIQQVHDFISKINGSHPAKFKEELIDGDAFLMLKQEDLVDVRCLGLKFGPALKVCNAINLIIRNSSSSS